MRPLLRYSLFFLLFAGGLHAEEFKSILPDGWFVSGAFGFGRYDTDLEPRYREDVLNNALLQPVVNPGTTALGYGSPWQNKGHAGFAIDVAYRSALWFAGYDAYAAGSTPAYQATTFSRSGGNTTTSMEDGRIAVLGRGRGTFYGGIPVGLGQDLSMDVFTGLRFLVVHAAYDSTLLSSTLSSSAARSDSVGVTVESTSESRAAGLVFGVEGQWKVSEKVQLRASAAVYNLGGTSVLDKVNAGAASAGGVLSGNAQLIHEEGQYRVKGSQVSLAGYYAIDTDLNLFTVIMGERSQTRKSNILRYDTSNFSNPARLMLEYLLSQGGSRKPDTIGTVRFGVEKRIGW